MQLIFVHGVATRSSKKHSLEERRRDRFFKDVLMRGSSVYIDNPKWGDLIPDPAWGELALPMNSPKAASYGLADFFGEEQSGEVGNALPDIAKDDLASAVDSLAIGMIEKAEWEGRDLNDEEFQLFAELVDYVEHNKIASWANDQMDDNSFAYALTQKLSNSSSYGLESPLTDAAKWVSDRTRNLVGRGLTAGFRDEVNPMVGRFLGDVFIYLKSGPIRDKIRGKVIQSIVKANARRSDDEPLLVVGHSMGGVIAVDLLSDPSIAELNGIEVDLLATVGSQPSHFEEYKLLSISDGNIGANKPVNLAPKPTRVKLWWNVFDPIDPLAFRCENIFDGVNDFQFSSSVGLIDAHTAYFKRPKFFERMRNRLRLASLLA